MSRQKEPLVGPGRSCGDIAPTKRERERERNDQVIGRNDQVIGRNDQVMGRNDKVLSKPNASILFVEIFMLDAGE